MAEANKEKGFKRFFGGIGRYFRELRSELKKVVWPTPKQVVKSTLVVIACCLIVGLFIRAFDFASGNGIKWLINAIAGLKS